MSDETAEGNRRILLVDDDADMLRALQRCLRIDFEVHVADAGKIALQMLQDDPAYAAALVDLHMLPMGGLEILKRIGEISPATKRIAITGMIEPDPMPELERLGVLRFLSKPCAVTDLIREIESAVTEYNREQAEAEKRSVRPTNETVPPLPNSLDSRAPISPPARPSIHGKP